MAKVKLNINRADLEGSRVQLDVNAPVEVVREASKRVAKQVLRHVTVPGFRRDKTPLAMVKRQVGAERFDEYVQAELLPQTYYDAVDQEGIQPISEVQYENRALSPEGAFTFRATFAVAPSFTLGDYKDLKIDKPEAEPVSEEMVEKFLEEFRQKQAVREDVAEGAAVESGHQVSLLLRGKVDGEDSPFLKHYNVTAIMGQEALFPDFDRHILGHKKLDRFEVEHTFAPDYFNKALAGKTASIEIKVLTHKTVVLPEINSEFLQKLGGFSDIQALKDAIRRELENKNAEEARKVLRQKLQDSLNGVIQCEVPKALVQELSEAKLHDLKADLEQRKTTFADFLQSRGQTEEQYQQEVDQASEKELRLSFALTQIANEQGMTVEDNEVLMRIRYTAMVLQKQFHEILEYVENLGRRVLIRAEIKQEKALHYLENLYFPAESDKAAVQGAAAQA